MSRAVFSPLLMLVLALGLILSGLARPPLAPGLQVDLCSDGGPVTVTLDAKGQPVAPHAPCPECLVAPVAALPPPAAAPGETALRAAGPPPPLPRATPGMPHVRPAARAPPVPV